MIAFLEFAVSLVPDPDPSAYYQPALMLKVDLDIGFFGVPRNQNAYTFRAGSINFPPKPIPGFNREESYTIGFDASDAGVLIAYPQINSVFYFPSRPDISEFAFQPDLMNRRQTYRAHFLETLKICEANTCGHYSTDKLGRVGCDLKPGCKSCIDTHLFSGGGCFADEPLFLPVPKDAKPDPGKPDRVRITIPPATYTPTRPLALCTVAVYPARQSWPSTPSRRCSVTPIARVPT